MSMDFGRLFRTLNEELYAPKMPTTKKRHRKQPKPHIEKQWHSHHGAPQQGIVVDASCVSERGVKARDGYFHGVVEWRAVDLYTGEELFRSHIQEQSTINIGEFCAIVDALRWVQEKGLDVDIYSDSQIAITWVRQRQMRTKMPVNEFTTPALKDAEERLEWLKANKTKARVKWWRWGESPADFGRK